MKLLFLLSITFNLFLFPQLSLATLPKQFTVGSYNLHGIKNPSLLKQDLAALDFVQIWAFQEVEGNFSDQTEKSILEILPPGKWYIYLQGVNVASTKTGIWEGQVIASRFPANTTETLPLNHTDKKNRVAQIAYFTTVSNENFFFVNTDHEVNIFSIDFYDRKKQLESLTEYFGKTNFAGVIAGDFNTTGGPTEIKATEIILKNKEFVRSTSFDQAPYTFESFFITKELDHFFSRGLSASPRYRFNDRKGSDHYPIYIEIAL